MAGVGFELKRLFNNRTVTGHIRAYSYSALITAGPFALMTGMVLAIQLLFRHFQIDQQASQIFTGAVVYSFVFSQILTAGAAMVLTRYVADCLSVGNYDDVAASLLGMGSLIMTIGGTIAAIFLWDKPLPPLTKFLAYLFFAQLLFIWLEGVYLSAIKHYKRLIFSYFLGVITSIITAFFLLSCHLLEPVQAALLAMDGGMSLIFLLFLVQIAVRFGMPISGMHFGFLPYFERHWRLFITATCYTVGIFAPNIIIWQGPWSIAAADTFRFAPVYDVVTFYAFLSILPLMAMFVVSAETNFYERYHDYFYYITRKGNYYEIDNARKSLLNTLWMELRHIVEFQLVFSLVFLSLGNYVLSWSGITYSQVNMYNVLLMAVFFTGVLQVITILLLYFDYQQDVMRLNILFMAGNIILGMLGLKLWGEISYGFTFFGVSAAALLYGINRLSHFAARLNYFIFCAQPVFYAPPQGIFTKFARALYGKRLKDLERLGDENE